MEKENILAKYLKFQMTINAALADEKLKAIRHDLADFTAKQFKETSNELINREQKANEVENAVSLILNIGSSLILGANQLFKNDNAYAAAALVRQLVEIEYLAWAFENDENEARKWFLSDKEQRMKFFTPAKLRKAAQGKFRSKDYGYHCELGGHLVPNAGVLLENANIQAQLLLSDMLGHSGRIWDHLIGWAEQNNNQEPISSRKEKMLSQYISWKKSDITTQMPPPP